MLTKAQVRTQVQQMMDDPSAVQWSAANLDILIDGVFDAGWRDILEVNPWANSQHETLTSTDLTSPGYFDESDLTPPTGGRIHMMQLLTRAGYQLQPITPERVVIEDNAVTARDASLNSYFKLGTEYWMFPLDATTDVEVRYSYLPQGFNASADGSALVWPESHVSALIFEAAGRALMKGAREDSNSLLGMAQAMWGKMLDDAGKSYPGPVVPFYADSPLDWGGM
jgi:hypothetical protein